MVKISVQNSKHKKGFYGYASRFKLPLLLLSLGSTIAILNLSALRQIREIYTLDERTRKTAQHRADPEVCNGRYDWSLQKEERADASNRNMAGPSDICADMPEDFVKEGRVPESAPGVMVSPQTNRTYSVHLITYGSKDYNATLCRFRRQAIRSGWFRSVTVYGPADLPQNFIRKFDKILKQPRGGGFWIWRFPVLRMALDCLPDGHYLAFADAGCSIKREYKKELLSWLDALHGSPHVQVRHKLPKYVKWWEQWWTSERVFQAFNVSESNKFPRTSVQVEGGQIVLRNGPRMDEFLDRIMSVLEADPWVITGAYDNETKEVLGDKFHENRHDQSIQSVACKVIGGCIKRDNSAFSIDRLRRPSWEDIRKSEAADLADQRPW